MYILLTLFAVLSLADDVPTNLRCTEAIYMPIPQSYTFHHAITADLATSQIELQTESGETETQTMSGLYFMYKEEEDNQLYISTCGAKTTLDTEIYVFSTCTGNVAQDVFKVSKSDSTCSSTGKAASFVDIKANETVYVMVRVMAPKAGSITTNFVKVNDVQNTDCTTASNIESVPYSDVSNRTSTTNNAKVECYENAMPARWYRFVGDGKMYLIDTCSTVNTVDTILVLVDSVTSGNTCNGAKCLKYNDEGCGKSSTGAALAFASTKDKEYFIGVFAKNSANGRYQMNVQRLDSTLPFTSQTIPSAWPKTTVISEYNEQYTVVYLSIVGTGNEVVLSTCMSKSTTGGSGVEVVSSCSATTVVSAKINGVCGMDQYKVYKFESGVTYIAKFFCKSEECTINVNGQMKSQNHYQCEDSLLTEDTYTENVPLDQLTASQHGCNGIETSNKGSWYLIQKGLNTNVEHYSIGAVDATTGLSTGIVIETHSSCDAYCTAKDTTGKHDVFLNSGSLYVFVYSSTGSTSISVGIVKYDEVEHSSCISPKSITIPFTTIGFIDPNARNTLKCSMKSLPSFWYNIQLTESVDLIATTNSIDTKADTLLEVEVGCYPEGECITQNDDIENSATKASKISFTAYSRTSYNLAVAQTDLVARAHRISIYQTTPLESSKCATSAYLDFMVPQQNLYVYTTESHPTAAAGMVLRGSYYRFYLNKPMHITVKTCTSGTEVNNLIGIFKKCETKTVDGKEVSIPDVLVAGSNSSSKACGNYGAQFTYRAEAGQDYYLFVGAMETGSDGMIVAEVILDDSSEAPHPEWSSDDSHNNNSEDKNGISGWGIWGILFYGIYFVLIVVIAIALIIFYKRKNSSSSSFSSF
ncbi:hypothetical protein EIN_250750 [Entamoeba invadens IP1]|uniref:Uncharacterized protein n=1 Tax=Entamoeba invadens IP1 TaxID=370355 RepID=A0A0A1UED2_ENTIV|nr:hypothetical protein EIN_250750 [Entamoeba invadens IP1]ELP94951.1 hypothetical protein EIN_250750 [Entamoeba invadens IP1]|eukprot:XP_004261722.1 hypothetical protein EIN_250750 [Entamoeba invadens IP1]